MDNNQGNPGEDQMLIKAMTYKQKQFHAQMVILYMTEEALAII